MNKIFLQKSKFVKLPREHCGDPDDLVGMQIGTTFLEDNLAICLKSFI